MFNCFSEPQKYNKNQVGLYEMHFFRMFVKDYNKAEDFRLLFKKGEWTSSVFWEQKNS
jgi:hypothetical protein